jgi:hypothetical protein
MKVTHTDTDNLIRIMEAGRAMQYNRVTDPELDDMLDPKGTHLVSFSMVHEHIGGVEVEPHMRAIFMLKFKDDLEPHDAIIDMSMDDFKTLDVNEMAEA